MSNKTQRKMLSMGYKREVQYCYIKRALDLTDAEMSDQLTSDFLPLFAPLGSEMNEDTFFRTTPAGEEVVENHRAAVWRFWVGLLLGWILGSITFDHFVDFIARLVSSL